MLAEQVHRHSSRVTRPILRVNCATLSESMAESELFGHEKGAFTGATQTKPGLFEMAEGGTMFLDEVGELPRELQAKLLRVIEDRNVWRVGAVRPRPVDVRFVSATNRVLEEEIAAGRFRQDLFFRLNGAILHVPPLRERPGEIRVLAQRFLRIAAQSHGRDEAPQFTPEALASLERHSWPGNIRELKNVVERAILLITDRYVGAEHLALSMAPPPPTRADTPAAPHGRAPLMERSGGLHEQIDEIEKQQILDALAACGGNQSEAARRLGISRSKLVSRLDRYGVPRPRK